VPGIENADFSVTQAFRFQESRSVDVRAGFFNVANHYNPDPGTVDLNVRSQAFGSFGGGVQGITTRVIQLGAKLNF
jgi:hypothetical protein